MNKNPYLASEIGKTFDDIRMKICRDLELGKFLFLFSYVLVGSVELMEMLVAK